MLAGFAEPDAEVRHQSVMGEEAQRLRRPRRRQDCLHLQAFFLGDDLCSASSEAVPPLPEPPPIGFTRPEPVQVALFGELPEPPLSDLDAPEVQPGHLGRCDVAVEPGALEDGKDSYCQGSPLRMDD